MPKSVAVKAGYTEIVPRQAVTPRYVNGGQEERISRYRRLFLQGSSLHTKSSRAVMVRDAR